MRASLLALVVGWGCGEQKFVAINAEPDVTITSHDDGDVVGEGEGTWFIAIVDDADDAEDELMATWTVGDRTVCEGEAVTEFGETTCEIHLADDEIEVAVYVEDPRGSNGGDAVRLDVQPTDAPRVDLTSPVDVGVNYYTDHPVLLEAYARDTEDLPEALLVEWSSDGQGELEAPPTPDSDGMVRSYVDLREGEHLIRVQVTDTTDKVGTDVVSINVQGPNRAPTCGWLVPEDGTVLVTAEPIILSGWVEDADVPADWLTVVWTSNRDGVLASVTPSTTEASARGEASITVSDLSTGEHTLTMTASDEVGATCTTDRLVVVTSRPSASILRPVGEVLYYADHLIAMEGLARDAEDDPDVLVAQWSSDVAGALAVPDSVNSEDTTAGFVSLDAGSHIITLDVTDADGVTGSDSSAIVVRGPNQPPTCELTGPPSGTGGDAAAVLTFTGTVDDEDIGPEGLTVSWASDLVAEALGASIPSSDGTVSLGTGALGVGTHRVTMTVTDEVGASCVDDTTVVIGRAPTVNITAPADDTISNVGSTVVFMAMVSDPDESASGLMVEWSSDRDGVLFVGAPDSVGFTTFSSDALTIGTHTITLSVTDSLGLFTVDVAVFRVNGLPTTPVVRIIPEDAYTTDTLGVVIDTPSVDPEGDPIVYHYEWFLGPLSLVGTSSTVSPDQTAKNQNWQVRVTPDDGSGRGEGALASRTIRNTPPTITDAEIGHEPIYTDDLAVSALTVFDPDEEDVVSVLHAWTVDGVLVAETDDILDGDRWFDKHQEIGLSVTPTDGDSEGATLVVDPVLVLNSPPTAPVIRITPDPVVEGGDSMMCRVDEPGVDADGDDIRYEVEWTRDADAYPGDSDEESVFVGPLSDTLPFDWVPTADFVAGEEWACAITTFDDEDEGGRSEVLAVIEAPPPGCGDGVLQPGEEFEPPPGPFVEVKVDPETCRWDFSLVEQLYCYGGCSWAGPMGCDQHDADILCKLITDNPDSVATSYEIRVPWTGPGFGSPTCDTGDRIAVNDRGVVDVSWMDVSLAAHFGGGGQVVAFPDCTDP